MPTSIGPATTENLVVKFDGEICGGVLVECASDDFPSKRSSKISFQTSPEVRHQFRRKLRQLHSGNRWCLDIQQTYRETLRELGSYCLRDTPKPRQSKAPGPKPTIKQLEEARKGNGSPPPKGNQWAREGDGPRRNRNPEPF